MKTIDLNTMIMDGMYMDIHSIQFEYSDEYFKTLDKCRKILKENPFLFSVSVSLFNTDSGITAVEYFDSTVDDEEKSTNVSSRIDTEVLIVYSHGVYYRGYSKWSSDFLEIDLGEIKK